MTTKVLILQEVGLDRFRRNVAWESARGLDTKGRGPRDSTIASRFLCGIRPTMRTFGILTCGAAAAALAKSVDYVVVGAGTSGLVVANRLSEDPSVTVAVIEPGKDERDNPLVSDLNGWAQAPGTEIDWSYDLVSPSWGEDLELKLPQGKGWGGTSMINGTFASVSLRLTSPTSSGC